MLLELTRRVNRMKKNWEDNPFHDDMLYVVDGELYHEFSVQGSTALNNSFVNYYIWDVEPGLTTPNENARILINNSKFLVRMNK